MPSTDETARWSLSERIELASELQSIKDSLLRIEEWNRLYRKDMDIFESRLSVIGSSGRKTSEKVNRIYWLAGLGMALVAMKDKIASLF